MRFAKFSKNSKTAGFFESSKSSFSVPSPLRCAIAFASLILLLALTSAVRSDPTGDDISPEVDTAIKSGLVYLAHQQKPDGSFESGGPRVAMTGLALMSFLANGDVPDEGKYGLVVKSAMEYLIKAAPADGYFGKVDGSRMYGHGIATLALAEACGADSDPARRKAALAVLQKAVKVILDAQDVAKPDSFAGGWRYEPSNQDSDLSLSGWNALALKACENVGIDIPKDRVKRAVGFVMQCYRPEEKGFAYQPGNGASTAMTGVGVLNLYLLDDRDRPQLKDAAQYLVDHPVANDTRMPYYAMYYSTQAAFQAGDPTWTAVWKATQARLLPAQNKDDGGWPQSASGEEPGRVYATAMALLTLSVPYRLLPIYQR